MSLKERVEQRLTALRMTPTGAANAMGGVANSFVRDIIKGRKRSVLGVHLTRLAVVLETTESWLLGAEGNGEGGEPRMPDPIQLVEIPMLGQVAAGVWVPEPVSPAGRPVAGAERRAIAPIAGYKPSDLFAVTVGRGAQDAPNLGYEPDCVLICARPNVADICAGDHVILATHQGPLVETVVRAVIALRTGDWSLADPIADPDLRDAWPLIEGAGAPHEVLGVVIASQMIRPRSLRASRR